MYSRLSVNRHLYKTDTSVKRTPTVGPFLSFLPLFDSLSDGHLSKRQLVPVPKVSVLERVDCIDQYSLKGTTFYYSLVKIFSDS